MQKLLGLVAMVAVWSAGCATPYGRQSLAGGYSETQLAPDVFKVHFNGNGFTSQQQTQDFTMLRAAELARQNGFRYFTVIAEATAVVADSFTTSGSATTTGYIAGGMYHGYTTYTPPTTYEVFKPQAEMLVRCFAEKPTGVSTFDVAFIERSIRVKYRLK